MSIRKEGVESELENEDLETAESTDQAHENTVELESSRDEAVSEDELDGDESDDDEYYEFDEDEEKPKSSFRNGETDPLGYLIVPIFGVILVAVIILWIWQAPKKETAEVYPVSGQVFFNKKPLKGYYQITFYPDTDNPDEVTIASGILEDDGSYELYTGQTGRKGAHLGRYRVVVKMLEQPWETWRMPQDGQRVEVDPRDGGTKALKDPDPPFNPAYSDRKKTPQRAVVVEGDNQINIEL